MTDDAGFAVAITIREHVLNDALLVAYTSGSFPHALAAAVPGGPPDAKIDFFLAPPKITCRTDHTMTISVEMWGPVTVDATETAKIDANLSLRIALSFVVQGTELVLEFNDVTQDVTATAWDFTTISGSLSAATDNYLRSDAFRFRLQLAIQGAISFRLVKLPSIDIAFLGPIVTAVNNMTAEARVMDGSLLLGLNIDSDLLTTSGDASQLHDFAKANDIAAVTSAAAVPFLAQQLRPTVSAKVSQNDATLEQFNIVAQDGRFHVTGRASNSQGTVNFSFNAIPTLFASRAGIVFQYLPKPLHVNPRTWPALGFESTDIQVDIDPAWWVDLITIVGFYVNVGIPLIIGELIDSTAAQFDTTIANANLLAPVPRVQRRKPTTPGGATVRVAIEEYDITSAGGTYIGLTVQPKGPAGALVGLTSVPSDFRGESLGYAVQFPFGTLRDDPALRVRWTVIDASANVLVTQDDVAVGHENFAFVPEVVGPGLTQYAVVARLYRALGAEITELVNDSIHLVIGPPLAPGAFVRWYYDVKNPQVQYDDLNQVWAYKGELVVKRHSNWHRTEPGKACENAAKRSRYFYQNDNLDALPFPLADIVHHRSELCDYCFFGSPGGNRPKL